VTAPKTNGLSSEARNLHWLLTNLVEEVPGLLSVAVVSSDGLLLLSSDPLGEQDTPASRAAGAVRRPPAGPPSSDGPRGSAADLASIVSGLGSLTQGAAKLMDAGKVRQTVVTMREGNLCVMAIGDGSLLGVHATPECDMSIVAYHMAFFVSRAGHVLTPELRTELRRSVEGEPAAGARTSTGRPATAEEQRAREHAQAPAGGAR
jgi:predicted regulator of Ras-like GTPase activity (Roadblock/LC7/MglB family)